MLSLRSGPPLFRVRPLIPCPAVECPARPLFVGPTPLLEVERHVGVDALVSYRAHPVSLHRASTRAALATRNRPVNASEVQLVERSEQRLQTQETCLRLAPAEMVNAESV